MVRANVNGGWVGVGASRRGGDECRLDALVCGRSRRHSWPPGRFGPTPTQPPLTFAGSTASYRAYAAGTPPSTLSMFPVLFPDRAGEAKCRTAWAMSSGKMLTPSVVRLR